MTAFYVTTPIFYVNGDPHLGHAYTTVLADVLARYANLVGRETLFVTGTDEHGQKARDAAAERGIDPQAHVDATARRFRAEWEALDVRYDDFIRTTEPRHLRTVEHVLTTLWERNLIYRGEYEGWYSVADERFFTDDEVADGRSIESGRPVVRLVESNYFLRISQYQQWLIAHIHSHSAFIQPNLRRNEVLGYLRQPLRDLCISRPAARLAWGVPLPFDRDFVTYVWVDALINYITVLGFPDDTAQCERFWPSAVHVIGKDILIPHCVYWPIILRAIGLPPPKTVFAHGWWLAGTDKISKTAGNGARPRNIVDRWGVDALRYFLIRELRPGRDTVFDESLLANRYEAELANDLGNLLHRIVALAVKHCGGAVPAPGAYGAHEAALRDTYAQLVDTVFGKVHTFAVNDAVLEVIGYVGSINRYLEQTAPWHEAKRGRNERVRTIVACASEALRGAATLLEPVLPASCREIGRRLGYTRGTADSVPWGQLTPGTAVIQGAPLFPRAAPGARSPWGLHVQRSPAADGGRSMRAFVKGGLPPR